MMYTLPFAVLLAVSSILVTNADELDASFVGQEADYLLDGAVKDPIKLLTLPSNNDDSIQYLLYTPKNWQEPCLLQPSADPFERCSFQPNYETKFLIHGYQTSLTKDNLFNVLKDAILENGYYNVIVVDWTLYNGPPFESAYLYTKAVGEKVAEMMKFIENYAKVSLKTFHCIGHSLGANICGLAGRYIQTLGRITGLDPEGFSALTSMIPNLRLNYKDAYFVDVIHTSDIFSKKGFGYLDPIGHLNFYPNSGIEQPKCVKGNTYTSVEGKTLTIQTTLDVINCNHFACIEYFTQSLRDGCKFIAIQCQSYSDFQDGLCSPGVEAEMGFYSKKIEGIPPMTKFYLTTLDSPPYCKG